MSVTVYELIQELAKYEPDTCVKMVITFNNGFENVIAIPDSINLSPDNAILYLEESE